MEELTQDELAFKAYQLYMRGTANHIEAGVPGSSHEGRDVLMVNRRGVAFAPRADA